ncbi:hypothetical protein LTR86_005183 [Recurvomyces mirabilis]|nr:hypothetical protein LTR86_005183 [Recurvomyces mirabilis]
MAALRPLETQGEASIGQESQAYVTSQHDGGVPHSTAALHPGEQVASNSLDHQPMVISEGDIASGKSKSKEQGIPGMTETLRPAHDEPARVIGRMEGGHLILFDEQRDGVRSEKVELIPGADEEAERVVARMRHDGYTMSFDPQRVRSGSETTASNNDSRPDGSAQRRGITTMLRAENGHDWLWEEPDGHWSTLPGLSREARNFDKRMKSGR